MKKRWSIALAMTVAACLAQAQVTWDGGAGSSDVTAANNWSDDTAPSTANDYVIDDNTNLRGAGNWIVDVGGTANFGSLTLDPTWTGGQVGVRGNSPLQIANDGALTITANYTDGTSPTFGPSTSGSLNIRTAANNGNIYIRNNSSTEVSFVGGAGGNTVDLGGRAGTAEVTYFGGTGDLLLGDDSRVLGNLDRLWTEAAFAGTLTLNNTVTQNTVEPRLEVRIQGGILKIGAAEQIADNVNIAFGTTAGFSGALNVQGITETAGVLNNFSDAAADLSILVDGATTLSLANFNDGGQTRGTIDVKGWDEGNSSVIFSSLSAYDYTVAEGEAFVGLTLDGNTAFMTDTGSGWAVSAIPEPATLGLVAAVGGIMVWVRRVFMI